MLIQPNDIVVVFETPIQKNVIKTYDKFLIRQVDVNINEKSARIVAILNENIEDDTGAKYININLSGSAYENWGTDDNYIINYCKEWLINNF